MAAELGLAAGAGRAAGEEQKGGVEVAISKSLDGRSSSATIFLQTRARRPCSCSLAAPSAAGT